MKVFVTLLLLTLAAGTASAQLGQIIFNGKLTDPSLPGDTNYDFEVRLYDLPVGGLNLQTVTLTNVYVYPDKDYSLPLSFNAAWFVGNGGRYVEIRVKFTGTTNYTLLTPREALYPVAYAIKSVKSDEAGNAFALGGLTANTYVQTSDTRLSDARSPLPNSPNYVQNSASPQPFSNFNISGTGKATIFDATEYSISGDRVLSSSTPNGNIAVGQAAGIGGSMNTNVGALSGGNSTGAANTFLGYAAGNRNTTGSHNSFVGRNAGLGNDTGSFNAVFGDYNGPNFPSMGSQNAIFGTNAGGGGSFNSFFGSASDAYWQGTGRNNNTGSFNSFFGHRSGEGNTGGSFNSFVGTGSGFDSKGDSNTFIGHDSGNLNGWGSFNTTLGENADVGATNLSNATAIGSKAQVAQSNSLVLGSINGVNGATADTNVGIGTTAPAAKLHVSGAGGIRARINSTANSGVALTLNNQPGWSVATVSGGQFQIFNDAIGQNALWITPTGNNVGIGTNSPGDKLDVNGIIRVSTLATGGGTPICRNFSNQLSSCYNAFAPRDPKEEVVKYERAINAVKEQQARIDAQQKQIEALRKIVCELRPSSEICGQ